MEETKRIRLDLASLRARERTVVVCIPVFSGDLKYFVRPKTISESPDNTARIVPKAKLLASRRLELSTPVLDWTSE
jgi:hypothetical protein